MSATGCPWRLASVGGRPRHVGNAGESLLRGGCIFSARTHENCGSQSLMQGDVMACSMARRDILGVTQRSATARDCP